jgi:hypothetical protein
VLVCVCVCVERSLLSFVGRVRKIEASRRAGRRCFLNDRLEFRALRSSGGTSKRSRRSVFSDHLTVSGGSAYFSVRPTRVWRSPRDLLWDRLCSWSGVSETCYCLSLSPFPCHGGSWPGVISNVRHQSACGSCWAFGSVSSLSLVTDSPPTRTSSALQTTQFFCSNAGSCCSSDNSAWGYFRSTGVMTGGDCTECA